MPILKNDKSPSFFAPFGPTMGYFKMPTEMVEFLKEFWEFLKERKKYWLLPIILVLALFGILIVLSQGSAVAPFIYTIF